MKRKIRNKILGNADLRSLQNTIIILKHMSIQRKIFITILIVIVMGLILAPWLGEFFNFSYKWEYQNEPISFELGNINNLFLYVRILIWAFIIGFFIKGSYKIYMMYKVKQSGQKIETKFIKLEKIPGKLLLYNIISEGLDINTGMTMQFKSQAVRLTKEQKNKIPTELIVSVNSNNFKYHYFDLSFLKNNNLNL